MQSTKQKKKNGSMKTVIEKIEMPAKNAGISIFFRLYLFYVFFVGLVVFSKNSYSEIQKLGDMKLKKIETIELKKNSIFYYHQIRDDILPFLQLKSIGNEIVFTDNDYGLSFITPKGERISKQLIAEAVNPIVQECLGNDRYLLFSMTHRTAGIWKKNSPDPIRVLRLNGEFFPSFVSLYDKNTLLVFLYMHEKISEPGKAKIMLIDFSDDMQKAGTIVEERLVYTTINENAETNPTYGIKVPDGRYLMLLANSQLIELNSTLEAVYVYEIINDFQKNNERSKKDKKSLCDYPAMNNPMAIYKEQYLCIERYPNENTRKLDIWDINNREYIGDFSYDDKRFVTADEEKIIFIDAETEDDLRIGYYNLILDSNQKLSPVLDIILKSPISNEKYSLVSVLPKIDKELMIFFTEPDNCTMMSYHLLSKEKSLPDAFFCLSGAEKHYLFSMTNSFVNSENSKSLNIDPDLVSDLPYAMLIDDKFKIHNTYSRDDIIKMLDGDT